MSWILKKLSELCKKSLKKWSKDSGQKISSLCPFCINSIGKNRWHRCSLCICPPEICSDNGKKGILGKLSKKYNIEVIKEEEYCYGSVNDITDEELAKIQNMFKKYII